MNNQLKDKGLYIFGNKIGVHLEGYGDKNLGKTFISGGVEGIQVSHVSDAEIEGFRVSGSFSSYFIDKKGSDFNKLLNILNEKEVALK